MTARMSDVVPQPEDLRDGEFLALFEEAKLQELSHRAHVRMAWLILREDGKDLGTRRILDGLRRLTVALNAVDKFHHTMTIFWIHVVDQALRRTPEVDELDAFLARNPHLLRSALPFDYYGRDRLMAEDARKAWIAPDLQPLP